MFHHLSLRKTFWSGIILIALFGCLAALIQSNNVLVLKADTIATEAVTALESPILTSIMVHITDWGSAGFLIPAAILLAVLLIYFEKWPAVFLVAISFGVIEWLTYYLKNLFHRLRPLGMLVPETGFSFPSGHTTGAFTFFVVTGFILASFTQKKHLRIKIISACLTIAFLVGLSRVYLQVHFLSDVVGGLLLASGISLVLISMYAGVERKMANRKS